MSHETEKQLEGIKESLRHWEKLGLEVLETEITELAEFLGIDIEAANEILKSQTITGKVDLSNFKTSYWAPKQVVKKLLEEENPQQELELCFSLYDQTPALLTVTNPVTGTTLTLGQKINAPFDVLLGSYNSAIRQELSKYREDQKFDVARSLVRIIRQTFVPISIVAPSAA